MFFLSWIKAHIAKMVPWRGIPLKFNCSYKNRAICQVNDFLPFFFSKLWPDQSRKCYIFCMKDFVSVLFLLTGPTREHWLQFKTKNKKIKKVVPNIWCHLEKKWTFYELSKVYRALQLWRYYGNLQEMIFQSMPYRISKCPIFMDKIAIEKKKWQKKSKHAVIP